MEINYIYCLIDPRTSQKRYIGKSKDVASRVKKHLLPYYLKADTYKNRWLRQLKSNGLLPLVQILSEVSSEFDNINDVEKLWIKIFRKAGHKLTNTTDGGDGGRTKPLIIKPIKNKRPYSWFDAVKSNSREWKITDPNGVITIVCNLNVFCREHNLNSSKMYSVAKGYENRTNHKGWKCEQI